MVNSPPESMTKRWLQLAMIHFLHFDSIIPTALAYGDHISQLGRTTLACSLYSNFVQYHSLLTTKLEYYQVEKCHYLMWKDHIAILEMGHCLIGKGDITILEMCHYLTGEGDSTILKMCHYLMGKCDRTILEMCHYRMGKGDGTILEIFHYLMGKGDRTFFGNVSLYHG